MRKVLSRKKDLKDVPVEEIRKVYLQQSRKEEVLMMERNLDLVLGDMGIRDEYINLPSGHLVRKESYGAPRGRGGCVHGCRGGRGGVPSTEILTIAMPELRTLTAMGLVVIKLPMAHPRMFPLTTT